MLCFGALAYATPAAAQAVCGARGAIDVVEAAGKDAVLFCMQTTPRSCWTVDLKTGRYTRAAVKPGPATATSDSAAAGLQACHPRTKQCKTLPKPAGYGGHRVTSDGKYIVVATTTRKPKPPLATPTWIGLELYSYATLKRLRVRRNIVKVADEANSVDLTNVGPSILLEVTPCAGPCTENWLINPRTLQVRTRINRGNMGGGANPRHVGNYVYAFTDGLEPKATFFHDSRSGRLLATVRWWPTAKKLFGDASVSPFEIRSAGTASGRVGLLFNLSSKPELYGDVLTFSRWQRKPRHLRFPACKK